MVAEVGKFIFALGAVEWDVTLPGRGRGFSATVYFTASHTVIADSTRIAIRNATSG